MFHRNRDIAYNMSSGNQFSGGSKLAKLRLAGRIDRSKKNRFSCLISFQERWRFLYPTIPTLQWDFSDVALTYFLEKKKRTMFDSQRLVLVMTGFHTRTGTEMLRPNPAKKPLWNPPGRGEQGPSKLDCVTVWTLYQLRWRWWLGGRRCVLPEESKDNCGIFCSRNSFWGLKKKTSLQPDANQVRHGQLCRRGCGDHPAVVQCSAQ